MRVTPLLFLASCTALPTAWEEVPVNTMYQGEGAADAVLEDISDDADMASDETVIIEHTDEGTSVKLEDTTMWDVLGIIALGLAVAGGVWAWHYKRNKE